MAEVTGMTPDRISQEISKEITNLKTYVNSGLSTKADTTYVNSGLSKKADVTYVDTSLSKKADTTQVNSGLSKKADITYVDSGLSKKADITYVDSLSPLKSFAGAGFPEGKVTAPVGTMYTDTAATNGAIRWIKTSGVGNTGWCVEYGDTGWRDISNDVDLTTLEIDPSGHVRIRRIERLVEYSFKGVKAKKSGNIYLAPQGFRPPEGENTNSYQTGFFSASTYWLGIFSVSAGTIIGSNREFILRLRSDNSWPASLPGIPI